MSANLLEVVGLKKHFPVSAGVFGRSKKIVHAVDGVSFDVPEGETLSLVGESGCGKTTCGRTILRLYEPSAGQAFFDGKNIFSLGGSELTTVRGKMQLIFQDPYSSLNPRVNVYNMLKEILKVHGFKDEQQIQERIFETTEAVGLRKEHIHYYPHEFSGGGRQRVAIVRSIILRPKLVVADEPVSALDVSIQAKILNLLKNLQEKFNMAYLLISHDLAVVRFMSHRVAVMYLGKIVETGAVDELYRFPLHPYTKALLAACPSIKTKSVGKTILEGDVPNPIDLPPGCRFAPRCPSRVDICVEQEPELRGGGHAVACHSAHRA